MKVVRTSMLVAFFMLLALTVPAFATVPSTEEQMLPRRWLLVYNFEGEYYEWREYIYLSLPFIVGGEGDPPKPQDLLFVDIAGDAIPAINCGRTTCNVEVFFEDFNMLVCQGIRDARLVHRSDTTITEFEHNFRVYRRETGFSVTFSAPNELEWVQSTNYTLTLECSLAAPTPPRPH